MAMSDYRLCDVCGGKAFYDASLNYETPTKDGKDTWGKIMQPEDFVRGETYALDRVGDWKVICQECAKTHQAIIVKIEGGDDGDRIKTA